MVYASKNKHKDDEEQISKLSSKIDELDFIRRQSLPISVHKTLMRE